MKILLLFQVRVIESFDWTQSDGPSPSRINKKIKIRKRHEKVNYITSEPDAVYQGASSADGAEAERPTAHQQ